MPFIQAENLTKIYRVRRRISGGLGAHIKNLFSPVFENRSAVQNLSFSIQKGEIVGFLGPNGAGKSTTIKMLVGILVPTSGHVDVGGIIPHKDRINHANRMGVVFGQRTQLWWDIPVRDSFNLIKYMFRIPEDIYQQNIELFSDILDLGEFINTPVRQLSLGQRMRADICNALLHNPEVVFFDEPTIGLDVVVKEKIRQFIQEINRERYTTVILTTHDMEDIERLCPRVIVIDKGQKMYDGDLKYLKDLYGGEETLIIEVHEINDKLSHLHLPGVTKITVKEQRIHVKYDKKQITAAAIITKALEFFNLRDFSVREVNTEEVIRELYSSRFLTN